MYNDAISTCSFLESSRPDTGTGTGTGTDTGTYIGTGTGTDGRYRRQVQTTDPKCKAASQGCMPGTIYLCSFAYIFSLCFILFTLVFWNFK